MATYSRILAWRIPWTEEPGVLQSMGSQRVGHNLGTKQNTKTRQALLNSCHGKFKFCFLELSNFFSNIFDSRLTLQMQNTQIWRVDFVCMCVMVLWNSLNLPWFPQSLSGPVLGFLAIRERLLATFFPLQLFQAVLCKIVKVLLANLITLNTIRTLFIHPAVNFGMLPVSWSSAHLIFSECFSHIRTGHLSNTVVQWFIHSKWNKSPAPEARVLQQKIN